MQFSRYRRLILKKWWLLALLEVIAVVATSYYSLNQPIYYSAKTTLILNPGVANPLVPYLDTNNTYVNTMADNYNLVMKSDRFLTNIIARLDFPISMEDLKKSFSSKLAPNTLFYYISATASSPEKAQKIATIVTQLFLTEGLNPTQPGTAETEDILALTAKRQREEIKALQTEIEELNTRLRQLRSSDLSDPKISEQTRQLSQELKDRLDMQSRLILAVSELEKKESSAAHNSAALVDEAKLPLQPESNQLWRNLLFAIVTTLALSIGVIVLLDYLDYTVRSSDELAQLTDCTIIGLIPLIQSEPPSRTTTLTGDISHKLDARLVTTTDFSSPASESYRALRTNVLFSSFIDSSTTTESKTGEKPETHLKSLLITSTVSSEGKSLTAANLAITFAQAGSKVLLVDADLRKPSLHRLFNLPNETGFSDLILAGPEQAVSFLQKTAIPDLRLLTAGNLPPNPSELLTSLKAAAIMAMLERMADLVIFDSPPVSLVTDATVLANRVAQVMLVVGWGNTRRDTLITTIANLKKVRANLIGTVLNRVQEEPGKGYHYYKGYGS
ncbi:MAG: polysaccharide biosynthesis tyrosine autokinase [Chloroflexi bacterium]|nr:polysaccharide biosynthesis tyrosine autokinase [Chloroflexota bacterium]